MPSQTFLPSPEVPTFTSRLTTRGRKATHVIRSSWSTVVHHVKNHVGVGIVCAVAYFDPGNWSVDLQAGAAFGYRPMLFVLLIAGLGAIVLQTLACRLGCVTGIDLASHCRLLLHDHPTHPRLVRRLVLYPLYVVAEIAIIATDLAELLGSAIGFCLIFPKLPLWAGVVLTAADVLIFLAFTGPSKGQGRPVRMFEFVITALVLAVLCCFIVLLVNVRPRWPEVFLGYLPSKDLFKSQPDAVYSAVGILGATVMPHALFLGSFLSTQDRVSLAPPIELGQTPPRARKSLPSMGKNLFKVSRADRVADSKDYRTRYGKRENNSLPFIRQHLGHAITDVVTSLVVIAVPINSAILIMAATVFYNKPGDPGVGAAGLFEAHDLIKSHVGNAAAFVFALALLCAGQTSGVTATLAGQLVSEGFIEWRITPFLRRLITRLISLVPSVVVAVAVGRSGINTLLVASQVALSIVLPFIAFPLIYLTSSEVVMRVQKPPPLRASPLPLPPSPSADAFTPPEMSEKTDQVQDIDTLSSIHPTPAVDSSLDPEVGISSYKDEDVSVLDVPVNDPDEPGSEGYIDFSNGWIMMVLSYAIWLVVLTANVYAIVMLAMGKATVA